MSDDDFIASFEHATLDNAAFHHADCVRMAFLYLGRYPPPEALHRFSASLAKFAAAKGRPQFAAANPDLLNWKDNILKKYYRDETLSSDLAKRVFLFPDTALH